MPAAKKERFEYLNLAKRYLPSLPLFVLKVALSRFWVRSAMPAVLEDV